MSLVEQELPTLPVHLSSPLVFSGVRVTPSLVLCAIVCPFVLFLLSIVLSVLFQLMDSEFPFWYLQTLLASPLLVNKTISIYYNL